jgi:hypothetical protein
MTNRRTTLQWVLAASLSALAHRVRSANAPAVSGARGYGTDPDVERAYQPRELWPLTLSVSERQTAKALADIIMPADDRSPSASAVGVVDFIDEWVSAPYPQQQADRDVVLQGLAWMNAESGRRFNRDFADLNDREQQAICDDICSERSAARVFGEASRFFAVFRDLTAGGFYTTSEGRRDLQYVGNIPLTHFDGPPIDLLQALGLALPTKPS